jgi:hypothetical protein
MERATRDDGTVHRRFKDGRPEWLQDLAYAAHDNGDIWPDDWRYEFIEEALDALADADPDADPEEVLYEIEPDIYTSDLTRWLDSSNSRVFYLTEVLEEFGGDLDGFQLLSMAQAQEKQETASQVLAFIMERAEDMEDA